ncbi:MAG TPA: cyclic nucleotide-binding domain-containing protein [Anaerolineae bacterium]|nr:cyclic nucleotide-binding domain-containing protein [Anaerolineae bacterium]
MPDFVSFLRSVPLFAGLSDQTLAALARTGRLRQVPKGKMLFSQSDAAEAFYVVRSGRIDIFLGSANGRELVINEMRAGDCSGEMPLITGQPRSTSAVARRERGLRHPAR